MTTGATTRSHINSKRDILHHAWQIADWAGTSEKMIYLHYRHLLQELIALAPVEVRSNPSNGVMPR